jgi:hypothetical protein
VAIDTREILQRFRSGAEEQVFFELLEMPRDVMSAPTIAFRTERDPGIRAFLIKVAWQRGEIGKRSLF